MGPAFYLQISVSRHLVLSLSGTCIIHLMGCSVFCIASSMELMSYNIRSNTALFPHCPPTALPLDWDDELPETVHNNVRERGPYDVVV